MSDQGRMKTKTLGGDTVLKDSPLIMLLGKIDTTVAWLANVSIYYERAQTMREQLTELRDLISSMFVAGKTRLQLDSGAEDRVKRMLDGLTPPPYMSAGSWMYARALVREVEVNFYYFLEWVVFDRHTDAESPVFLSIGEFLNRLSQIKL